MAASRFHVSPVFIAVLLSPRRAASDERPSTEREERLGLSVGPIETPKPVSRSEAHPPTPSRRYGRGNETETQALTMWHTTRFRLMVEWIRPYFRTCGGGCRDQVSPGVGSSTLNTASAYRCQADVSFRSCVRPAWVSR